jgi:hypothetical protein
LSDSPAASTQPLKDSDNKPGKEGSKEDSKTSKEETKPSKEQEARKKEKSSKLQLAETTTFAAPAQASLMNT